MNTTPFGIIEETLNFLYRNKSYFIHCRYFPALVITSISVFYLLQILITYNSVKDTVYPPVN